MYLCGLWLHWNSLAPSQVLLSIAWEAESNGLISPSGTGGGLNKNKRGLPGDIAGMTTAHERARREH